ncbi:5'/3'-nucleotidase SurE [Portibacter lacus]|uniref:5'-nucleotidase SurE n=1 Tax=Portibacter lacus TaxID=1099794 RepID=A0AA37WG38_9BACT|nr:5'/3'-nucleotidase SurE [Portibacter lacus]GLR19423.1 5'-nucleotidase SurE [Portibacter lacus]
MNKKLILVTNDDGITAPGIRALVTEMQLLGEVVVVAPDSPQSGQGHAITLTEPIRLKKVDIFKGIEAYECTGTPVDCVKLAKNVILKDRTIDLCVSGINHGSNASINIIYSGTMSAAMEASIEGINSIGYSLLDFSYNADFSAAASYARRIAHEVLRNGMPESNLLNVNIPAVPMNEIKGIKVCRQAEGNWNETFQEGKDPRGQKYYWLTGEFDHKEHEEDTDLYALEHNYVSIVPSAHDLTNYKAIPELGKFEKL